MEENEGEEDYDTGQVGGEPQRPHNIKQVQQAEIIQDGLYSFIVSLWRNRRKSLLRIPSIALAAFCSLTGIIFSFFFISLR